MSRCAICSNYHFKDGKLARLALGNCKIMRKWEYPNPLIERECEHFKQVSEPDMAKRLEWEKGQ